jgi:hypothetical protein
MGIMQRPRIPEIDIARGQIAPSLNSPAARGSIPEKDIEIKVLQITPRYKATRVVIFLDFGAAWNGFIFSPFVTWILSESPKTIRTIN